MGQADAVAVQHRFEGVDPARVGDGDQDEVGDPARPGPRHRARVGLRGAVAQVVAGDQPAHAVADDVEAGRRVAAGLGQRLQRVVQPPRRLDQVAPPVVAEDVVAGAAAAGRRRGMEPGRGQDVEQVVVLGEAEQARHDRGRAQERPREEVVAALGERKGQGQGEVIVPDCVADVQPDRRAVGAHETAAHDARDDDDRSNAVAGAAEQSQVEGPPARSEGVGDHHPAARCQHAPEERLEPVTAAGPLPVHQVGHLGRPAPAPHFLPHHYEASVPPGCGAGAFVGFTPKRNLYSGLPSGWTAGIGGARGRSISEAPAHPAVPRRMARRLLLPARRPIPGESGLVREPRKERSCSGRSS